MVIEDSEFVGHTTDIFPEYLREWCLWFWQQSPKKIDTGQKFRALSYFEQPWNNWFKKQVEEIIDKVEPTGIISHITLHEDYAPGGIHSDGLIKKYIEIGPVSRSYLFPLNISQPTYSLVFNQKSMNALSLNSILGLGNKGIVDYEQTTPAEIGIDTTQPFDFDIWQKYLDHIKYESCAGLTTIAALEWKIGCAITWPRENLHTSANFSKMTRQFLLVQTCEKI